MALPWIASQPQLQFNFSEGAAGWSGAGNDGGTLGAISSSARSLAGAQSLKVDVTQADANGDYYLVSRSVPSMDFSASDLIHIRVSFEDGELGQDLGGGMGVRIRFGTGTGNSSWTANYAMAGSSVYREKWIILTVRKSDFATAGGAGVDWSDVTNVWFYVKNQWVAYSRTGSMTFDSIWSGGEMAYVPVVFSLDDLDVSQKQYLFDPFAARGWRCSLGFNFERIDGANYLSQSQFDEVVAQGHELLNHTSNHITIGSGTGQDLLDWQAEVDAAHADLAARGVTERNYFVHTSGIYNQAAVDYLESLGYIDGRSAKSGYVTPDPNQLGLSGVFEAAECPIPFELNTFNLSDGAPWDTFGNLLPYLQDCIARRQIPVIYGHKFVTDPTGDNRAWSIASINALIAWLDLDAEALPLVPMSLKDYLDHRNGLFRSGGLLSVSSGLAAADGARAIPPDYRYGGAR